MWHFGGFGVIPTRGFGDFKDQLGSSRSSLGKANRRFLEFVSIVLRRTTGKRSREQLRETTRSYVDYAEENNWKKVEGTIRGS